jgi:GNAT superfamily N-acetyltransferase
MVIARSAAQDEVDAVASLLDAYMRELFGRPFAGSSEALRRDGFGRHFEIVVAERSGILVGVAMFRMTYDVHHCLVGGELMDLYVWPAMRGRGVALTLVAKVSAMVASREGRFVKGLAVGAPETRRAYERLAMAFEGADCIVGGRAFRTLASLDGARPREMLRRLPSRDANYEP